MGSNVLTHRSNKSLTKLNDAVYITPGYLNFYMPVLDKMTRTLTVLCTKAWTDIVDALEPMYSRFEVVSDTLSQEKILTVHA
jgi:hypothetical protein